jgi:tetratricopeptide (TPR) repeat protein
MGFFDYFKSKNEDSEQNSDRACRLPGTGPAPESAIQYFDKSTIISTADTTSLKEKGKDQINQKKYYEARLYFEKALSLDPSDKEIHLLIGNTALMQKNYAEAKSFYEKALEIDPNYLEAMNRMWIVLFNTCNDNPEKRTSQLNESLDLVNRAISLYPTHKDFAHWWYMKGCIIENLFQPEEAIKAFTRAIEINPNIDYFWSFRGMQLQELGRNQEAINDYQKALQLNPKCRDCQEYINDCRQSMRAK